MEEGDTSLIIGSGIIILGFLMFLRRDKMSPEQFTFTLGVLLLLFSVFYLERELTREHVFWLFAGLGVLLGLAAVYSSYTKLPYLDGAGYRAELERFQMYVTFAVLTILMAIFYYPGGEEEPAVQEKPRKKPKKKKGKKAKK